MRLIDSGELSRLFKEGRFQTKPTIFFATLECLPGCPLEFTIQNAQGVELGAVWQSDIDNVLALAEKEGDTTRTNKNLESFRTAASRMEKFRQTADAIYANDQLPENKVVPRYS